MVIYVEAALCFVQMVFGVCACFVEPFHLFDRHIWYVAVLERFMHAAELCSTRSTSEVALDLL